MIPAGRTNAFHHADSESSTHTYEYKAPLASAFDLFLNSTILAAPILVPTLDDNTPGVARKLRGGPIDYSVVITNTGD